MATDLLRIEGNERLDLEDLEFALNDAFEDNVRHLTETLAVGAAETWIVSGFQPTKGSGEQVSLVKGSAILARRDGGKVNYGIVATAGDTILTVDVSGLANGTYGIYVRFEYRDAEFESRAFWSAGSPGEEIGQTIPTRRQANWSVRVESSNPGAEWTKVGEVDVSAAAITEIRDQRPLFFDGNVSYETYPTPASQGTEYQSGWSSDGGGDANDRDPDRKTFGATDLQTQLAAVRQCIEDLKGRGLRNWWSRDIGGLNVGFDADPAEKRVAVGDANFSLTQASAELQEIYFDTNDKFRYARSANEWTFWIGGTLSVAVTQNGLFLEDAARIDARGGSGTLNIGTTDADTFNLGRAGIDIDAKGRVHGIEGGLFSGVDDAAAPTVGLQGVGGGHTGTGQGAYGLHGVGGASSGAPGSEGVHGQGGAGNGTNQNGGIGIGGIGGQATGTGTGGTGLSGIGAVSASTMVPGDGVRGTGGSKSTTNGQGGIGLVGVGGNSIGAKGGTGATITAGVVLSGNGAGGDGLTVTAGDAFGTNQVGGTGATITAGDGTGTAGGGLGLDVDGGAGGGVGGTAIQANAGASGTGYDGGTGIAAVGGNGNGTNQAGGVGLIAQGGNGVGTGDAGPGIVGTPGTGGTGDGIGVLGRTSTGISIPTAIGAAIGIGALANGTADIALVASTSGGAGGLAAQMTSSGAATALDVSNTSNGPCALFSGNSTHASVNLGVVSADPSSPSNGEMWLYENGATREIRVRMGGVTYATTVA